MHLSNIQYSPRCRGFRWGSPSGQDAGRDAHARQVLVEMYTSQGCDMCPEAERMLGAMGEEDPRIVPIAFHVDHFNDPWKEVFSDELYSRRQMAYNQLYTQPKHPDCGLYQYVDDNDRRRAVRQRSGRRASARSMIRRALGRKPAVAIDVNLALDPGFTHGYGHRQGDEPGRPCRENAAAGLRRAPRGRRRHPRRLGRERRQVAGREFTIPGTVRRNTSSSSWTASRPRSNGSRSPSSRPGIGASSGWPCSSRTSAMARCTRRRTFPWQTTSTTGDSSTPAEKAAAGTH